MVDKAAKEEKAAVEAAQEAAGSELRLGEAYYVVPSKWWRQWQCFVKDGGTQPEKINFDELLDENGLLKESGIEEVVDYTLKPVEVWEIIKDRYGVNEEISGKVLQNDKGELYVDLFPMRFEVFEFDARTKKTEKAEKETLLVVSRGEKIKNLLPLALEYLGFSSRIGECRLWVSDANSEDFNLLEEDTFHEPIRDVLTGLGTWKLLLEVKDPDSKSWPFQSQEDGPSVETIVQRRRAESTFRESPKVGHCVDARRRKDKRWYEAVVVKLVENPDGSQTATVHYLSFDASEDEEFDVDDEENLQSPYSRVPDWRTQLRKDEEIEVNRRVLEGLAIRSTRLWNDQYKGTWLIGKVRKFKRNSLAQSSDTTTQSSSDFSREKEYDVEEDGLDTMSSKRKRLANHKTSSLESSYSSQGAVLVEVKTGTYLYQREEIWIDLDSEDIAQKYTHTTKPATTYGSRGVESQPAHSGVVGLRNLGNTCFMNSMLQCMSFTLPLTNYFLRRDYEDELNRKNPLGTGGKLAEAYAGLIHSIWSDKYSVFAPTEFKQQLGRAFTQFQGYQQQDSHEFFSLLADGLHEDLNRIKKKPFTEGVEGGNGRPDREVAKESWEVFKLRNDSVIVDTMMGLLRSHLTCPQCQNDTVKFDAFSNWSVPIPKEVSMTLHIVLVPKHTGQEEPRLRRFVLELPRNAEGEDVAQALSEMTGIKTSELLLAEISSNHVTSVYHNPFRKASSSQWYLKDIKSVADDTTDFVAWELDGADHGYPPSVAEIRFTQPNKPAYYGFRISDVFVHFKQLSVQDLDQVIWEHVKYMFKSDYEPPAQFLGVEEEPNPAQAPGDISDSSDHFSQDSWLQTKVEVPYEASHYSKAGDIEVINVEFTFSGIEALKEEYKPKNKGYMYFTTVEERDEAFTLGEVVYDKSAKQHFGQSKTSGIDLYKCFDRFREREQLGEQDEWYCPKCKELVRAFKQMDLWTAPEILVVHLKRFYYERNQYMRSWVDREKISDLVQFPLTGLDLSEYILGYNRDEDPKPIYDLYGVSNHIGGLGGGHYTAYVKHAESEGWHLMDDSRTSPATPEDVVSPEAYVLFYKRRPREDE